MTNIALIFSEHSSQKITTVHFKHNQGLFPVSLHLFCHFVDQCDVRSTHCCFLTFSCSAIRRTVLCSGNGTANESRSRDFEEYRRFYFFLSVSIFPKNTTILLVAPRDAYPGDTYAHFAIRNTDNTFSLNDLNS